MTGSYFGDTGAFTATGGTTTTTTGGTSTASSTATAGAAAAHHHHSLRRHALETELLAAPAESASPWSAMKRDIAGTPKAVAKPRIVKHGSEERLKLNYDHFESQVRGGGGGGG